MDRPSIGSLRSENEFLQMKLSQPPFTMQGLSEPAQSNVPRLFGWKTSLAAEGSSSSASGLTLRPLSGVRWQNKFAIHLRRQIWNCRGCRRGGDIIKLVRHIDGTSFNEAVRMLAGDRRVIASARPRGRPI